MAGTSLPSHSAGIQSVKEAPLQSDLQSEAALEAMLQNPALSETEKARIREEAKTKGLAAVFTLAQTAAVEAASHRGADEKIERMESRITQLEKNLKSHFRKPADDQPPPNAVIIPPLTAEQHAAVQTWNTAAQVATVLSTGIVGVIVGVIIGFVAGGPPGALAGSVVGATIVGGGWGAYELSCMTSVQDEFDEAHQQGSNITVWRDGWKFNVDGNNNDGFYTQANSPLSALYVAGTTWLLTGKVP